MADQSLLQNIAVDSTYGTPRYFLNTGGAWRGVPNADVESMFGNGIAAKLQQLPESVPMGGNVSLQQGIKQLHDSQFNSLASSGWLDKFAQVIGTNTTDVGNYFQEQLAQGKSFQYIVQNNPYIDAQGNPKAGAPTPTNTPQAPGEAPLALRGQSANPLGVTAQNAPQVATGGSGGSSTVVPSSSAPAGYGIDTTTGKFAPLPQGGGTSSGAGSINTTQQSGAGSSGTPFVPYTDGTSAKQFLTSQGQDVSQISDEQALWLANSAGAIQTVVNNDASLNWSGNVMDTLKGALQVASSYVDPRYADQWTQYQADITQNVAQLTGQAQDQQTQQAQQMQQQNEALKSQMAEAGLAQSGIRQKAEAQLKTQQQGVISSNRRALQQQIYTLGSQAEKAYGAAGAALVPKIGDQSYSPIGVKYASQPEAQQQQVQSTAQNWIQSMATPTMPSLKPA